MFFLIVISAISAIVLDHFNHSLYFLFKPLTTILIIGVALLFKNEISTKYNNLIIAGLLFCLLGDVLLLKSDYFVWGLGAFLVGHFLFSEAFRSFDGVKVNYKNLIILSVLGLLVFLYLYDGLGEFMVPAFIYIAVIIYMSWMGMSFHKSAVYTESNLIPLAVILFMFSDILISIDKFKVTNIYFGAPILLTYWSSIFLIALSVTKKAKPADLVVHS